MSTITAEQQQAIAAQERLAIIMEWMWGTVLPSLQPMAEEGGFGDAWLAMTTERTTDAAYAAADAAYAAADAAEASWEERAAAGGAARAAWAAGVARPEEAEEAARVVANAARALGAEGWTAFDPCGLLERMISVGEQNPAA